MYRFIMASTVEEKIYEKQVFKDGLRVVTGLCMLIIYMYTYTCIYICVYKRHCMLILYTIIIIILIIIIIMFL